MSIIVGHSRATGRTARAGMAAARVGVATDHIANGIIGSVLIGYAAYPGHGMRMIGSAIGVGSCGTAGDAIQVIVGVRLTVRTDSTATGQAHTVIAARRGSAVARPDQATQRVVTKCLIFAGSSAALRGNCGAHAQDVAVVVIGTRLTVEGLPCFCGADTQGTLDGVVAQIDREQRDGRAGLRAAPTYCQAGELAVIGIGGFAYQETDWIGGAGTIVTPIVRFIATFRAQQ